MRESGTSRVWTAEEAALHLGEILSESAKGPQRVLWQGRQYLVSLDKTESETAHEFLSRGGPLADGETF